METADEVFKLRLRFDISSMAASEVTSVPQIKEDLYHRCMCYTST